MFSIEHICLRMLDSFINEYRHRKPDGLGTPDLCVFFLRSLLGCILHWLRISYVCNVYCLPVNYIRTPVPKNLIRERNNKTPYG